MISPGHWLRTSLYSPARQGNALGDPADRPVETGRLDEQRWQRWLDPDPVRMVAGHADALRGLRGIWVDAALRDEYFLDLGAQAFLDELAAIGVDGGPGGPALHGAFHEAGHANINHRYPQSLAWLASVLDPAGDTAGDPAGDTAGERGKGR